jgi:hypothetical protein
MKSFSTSFTVDQTPDEVFAAINNVRGWWSGDPGVEGPTAALGDEFTYRYEGFHMSRQKVTELIPGRKVVWLVTDSQLTFVEDKSEWNGTKIMFDIARRGDRTEVTFTHLGLIPDYECYESCSSAWGTYINGNLRSFIATGKAEPDPKT